MVHANLTIPIHRHETEGGINGLVDDREVQPIALSNRLPVVDTSTTQWIDPQADLSLANGLHIQHISQLIDVGIEVIIAMGSGCTQGLL